MTKHLLPITLIAVCASQLTAENVPAFPGAEGFGRYVTGGRGGNIVHVTNLNDSGAGSLRAAVSNDNTKTIVFDVGGYIDLKSDITVGSNTTIAGQTAPGDGITLRYFTLKPKSEGSTQNVIIRFIRSRRSQVKDVNDGADAMYFRKCKKLMFDHCSFSWSIDEVASCYDNAMFTMQWCTVAEGLCNAGHNKGAHSYGGIWGGKEASFHHNFIAHVQNRAPRFNGARYQWDGFDKTRFGNTVQAEQVDFRNCVVYNWGTGGCYGGPGGGYINMVNNYYKAGPGTKATTRVTTVSIGESGNSTPTELLGYSSRYYIKGNYVTAASSPANYDWSGVAFDSGFSTIGGERYMKDAAHLYGENVTYVKNSSGVDCVSVKLNEPIACGEVTTHNAVDAYANILNYCGASLHRDATDARYMEEARTGTVNYLGNAPVTGFSASGTKGILDYINDPAQPENTKTASFPALATASRPAGFDTDNDGMPDDWERANGLNPNDPSDAKLKTVDSRGWYTNIEVYINSLVEDIMKAGNANAQSGVDEYYPVCKPAGINTVKPDCQVVAIEYFTVQGIRISEPVKGVNVRRITYSDGSVSTDKVLK